MSVCNKVSSGRFDPLNVSTFEDKDKTRIVKNTKSFSGVPYTVILPWGQRISFSIFSTGRFIVAGLDMKACKRAFPYVLAVLYRNKLAAEHRIPSADLTVACVRRMYLNQYKDGDCVIDSMKGAIEQAEKEVVVREDILKQILENNKKRAKRPTEDDDTEDFKIQRIR
jgi:hypothetical protein